MISRRHLLAGSATGIVLLATGCAQGSGPAPDSSGTDQPAPRIDPKKHSVKAKPLATDLSLPADAAGALTVSRELLAAATAVVVLAAPDASATATATSTESTTDTATDTATATAEATASETETSTETAAPQPDPAETAATVARALGLPLFEDSPELSAELERLQTRTVIAYGGTPQHVGSREVVSGPATASEVKLDGLPITPDPSPVLSMSAGELAAPVAVTLASAGLTPTELIGPHPGVTAESTAQVRAHEGQIVAIGDGFGTSEQFAAQVEVTRTAQELPGGGIAPFPGRMMIAFYGHPSGSALGMLGEQPPAEAVTRLKKIVDQYQELLHDQKVIGSFEIITTVASASAGEDGDYSYETPIDQLMPWIEAAEANDIYIVLDLQPGRTGFLTQAKRYEELLKRPWVGLAIDPEWRLPPDGKHLVQIGQVQIEEVNELGAWLADFVAEHKLPPKMLTLHQFQTRMIPGRERLDTSRPEVQYLVHVDGQGGQGAKQGTWSVMKKDLPKHVWLGWKNFEDEDIPMLTPAQTVAQVHPTPQFVSYQ